MHPIEMKDNYSDIEVVRCGDQNDLDELELRSTDFPFGFCPDYIERSWVHVVLSEGSPNAVEWLIKKHPEVIRPRIPEGDGVRGSTPPIHAVMDREGYDLHLVLQLVLEAGPDVEARGLNGYTAAHRAVLTNDVVALRLLQEHGANLSSKALVDESLTPREEAEQLIGENDAVILLRKWGF